MLVQFSVENYRSILGRQTLSMVASKYFKEMEVFNTFEAGGVESVPRLLRSNVIYGPNASGKSTLVSALDFMRDRVINSAKESQANDEIDVAPFKLTETSRAGDSEFEVAFIEDGIRYQYGFRCNRRRFTEEWLFAYPEGRAQKWFQRVFDPATGRYTRECLVFVNGSTAQQRTTKARSELVPTTSARHQGPPDSVAWLYHDTLP
jgi:energy-coupling factor transporter ATP-binding protein EcfA2